MPPTPVSRRVRDYPPEVHASMRRLQRVSRQLANMKALNEERNALVLTLRNEHQVPWAMLNELSQVANIQATVAPSIAIRERRERSATTTKK
jgi:hypothetical protein